MNQEVDTVHVPEKEERTWGMFCHLVVLPGFIIPFAGIIGTLVIWMIKKDEMPFVDDQGKESLNFQITMMFAMIVSGMFAMIVPGLFIPALIGFALSFVVAIFLHLMSVTRVGKIPRLKAKT